MASVVKPPADNAHPLHPSTERKVVVWQMLVCGALLALLAIEQGYTVAADRARVGAALPLWQPFAWELSSCLVLWLMIPLLAWWLARFPLAQGRWRRSLPPHLLATLPFSLLHTTGMIMVRKLVYVAVGTSYRFGAFWENWLYEYRKDFLTYWVVIGALLGFRAYGLWLDARAAVAAEQAPPDPDAPPDAGVSLDSRVPEAPLDRLVVRKRNREFILQSDDIDRIEADGNYVVIHAAGESYRLRESLDGLSRRLGEQRFARVHRTHVVNIDRIREIQPWDHGDYRILLRDGSFVNFSRRYRSRLSHLFR